MTTNEIENSSPYAMVEPPTSPGRALLARAFTHYCALHFGYSAEEIAHALGEGVGGQMLSDLGMSTRLLGELLARGDIRSSTRPIGGGEPAPMRLTLWELDDFRARFAMSALNMAAPFDGDAPVTHWIFVDLADWNRVVEMSLGIEPGGAAAPDAAEPSRRPPLQGSARGQPVGKGPPDGPVETDRLIRLSEVMTRTSLSKPTVYRYMAAGRFPDQILLPGRIAVWREREVANWINCPR